MRKFTISDIHGCAKTFKALLQQISFSKEDELYLLGDYIDRGPDSRGVIDHIWHLQNTGHTIHCLRGNHEQMFLYDHSNSKHLKKRALVLNAFNILVNTNLLVSILQKTMTLPLLLNLRNHWKLLILTMKRTS